MQRSILHVDDDGDILDSIRVVLESEGYTVYSAIDADQAKTIFSEHTVHLVIMDYIFKEYNGDQLIRDLKKIDENFSIIFLSGWPQVISAVEKLEYEVYRVFLKPLNPEVLVSALNSIFSKGMDSFEFIDVRQLVTAKAPPQ